MTTTYTYEFDVVKTNDANQLLEGAVFSLYTSEEATTPMNLVAGSTGVYRLPTKDDTTTVTTFTAGKVTIQGLAMVITIWKKSRHPRVITSWIIVWRLRSTMRT